MAKINSLISYFERIKMSDLKQDRRGFIGLAFGAVAAVGGVFALGGMKKS